MGDWVDLPAALPGLRGDSLYALRAAAEARVVAILRERGFTLRIVEGARLRDEASFFAEMARVLDLPEHFGANWDALHDALGDLEELPASRLAFVVRDADQAFAAHPASLLGLLQALVAMQVLPANDEHPLQLEIFLLGASASFPDLD